MKSFLESDISAKDYLDEGMRDFADDRMSWKIKHRLFKHIDKSGRASRHSIQVRQITPTLIKSLDRIPKKDGYLLDPESNERYYMTKDSEKDALMDVGDMIEYKYLLKQ